MTAHEKLSVFADLLNKGVATVYLDARRPGVVVPAHLAQDPIVLLNFAYGYKLADFEYDENGIVATLSFGGRNAFCRVPWAAVFTLTDEMRRIGRIWPEDTPADIRRDETDLVLEGGQATTAPKRGHLRVIRPEDVN